MLGIELRCEAFHRYDEFGGPSFGFFVESDAATEAAVEFFNFAVENGEVDPEIVGADFEFLVDEGIAGVGLEESFGNVAIPHTVAPAVGSRVGENGNRAVVAVVSKKERVGSPEKTDFGGALGISIFAFPVLVIVKGLSSLPSGGRGETVGVWTVFEVHGDSDEVVFWLISDGHWGPRGIETKGGEHGKCEEQGFRIHAEIIVAKLEIRNSKLVHRKPQDGFATKAPIPRDSRLIAHLVVTAKWRCFCRVLA